VAKLADAAICGKWRGLTREDSTGFGERRLIVLPERLPFERCEVICDLVGMNIPHEGASAGRELEALENIDIEGELNGIVEFRLAITLIILFLFAPAGLDVARV
jgi:hypothetical protein